MTKAQDKTLSYRTLANDFQMQIVSRVKGGKGFKPGAFRPTYGLDPICQLDQSDEVSGDASNEKGQNKSGKGGRKRPRRSIIKGSQEENCPIYELRLKLPNYFYVFPEKAFEGFKP